MSSIHNIAGSEIVSRHRLLPGYAAMKMGPAKPRQWRWRHTSAVLGLFAAALTYAGVHGMLP